MVPRTPTKRVFCCGARASFAASQTQQNKNFVAFVAGIWYNSIIKRPQWAKHCVYQAVLCFFSPTVSFCTANRCKDSPNGTFRFVSIADLHTRTDIPSKRFFLLYFFPRSDRISRKHQDPVGKIFIGSIRDLGGVFMQTYSDCPQVLREFLSYHETIKGQSQRTISEYYLDLRMFLRFMRLVKDEMPYNTPLDSISIKDLDITFIKTIILCRWEIYMIIA